MDKLKIRFMIMVLRMLYVLVDDRKAFSRYRAPYNKLVDDLEYEDAEATRVK